MSKGRKSKNRKSHFDALVEDDKETLKLFSKTPSLIDFQNSANRSITSNDNPKSYNFCTHFDTVIPRQNNVTHQIFFGGLINPAISMASYQLIILDENEKPYRLMHFDFEPFSACIANRELECKPSSHIQFGGNPMPTVLESIKSETFKNIPNICIEKPRIPSVPTTLAFFTHWLLLEFGTSHPFLGNFCKNQEWNNRLQKSEENVIIPFLNEVSEYRKTHRKNLLDTLYRMG